MRPTISNGLLFLLCTFFACAWVKLFNERNPTAIQLGFFGTSEEVTRKFLSRRLGWPVSLSTILTAAAPLDYLLLKGTSSWRLFGVGPCDSRRSKHTERGGCMPLQAHACYLYGASMSPDLQRMADCYDVMQVSAGEAKRHAHECHPNSDLPWDGFAGCIDTGRGLEKRRKQSNGFSSELHMLMMCAKSYGIEDEVSRRASRTCPDGSSVEIRETSPPPPNPAEGPKCRRYTTS